MTAPALPSSPVCDRFAAAGGRHKTPGKASLRGRHGDKGPHCAGHSTRHLVTCGPWPRLPQGRPGGCWSPEALIAAKGPHAEGARILYNGQCVCLTFAPQGDTPSPIRASEQTCPLLQRHRRCRPRLVSPCQKGHQRLCRPGVRKREAPVRTTPLTALPGETRLPGTPEDTGRLRTSAS